MANMKAWQNMENICLLLRTTGSGDLLSCKEMLLPLEGHYSIRDNKHQKCSKEIQSWAFVLDWTGGSWTLLRRSHANLTTS